MPRSKKGNNKPKARDPAITALAYHGPIVPIPQTPVSDEYVTVLGSQGIGAWGASTGGGLGRFVFRAASAGGIPASITGNFTYSVGDVPSFASFAGEFGSFRVLGLKVTAVSYMTSSTDGFGTPPLLSTVVRDNSVLTKLIDTPGVEIHPVSTSKNMFHREMRMEGVDESEWVDCGNVYTAISPQPTLAIQVPDVIPTCDTWFFMQYRVQFRGRL